MEITLIFMPQKRLSVGEILKSNIIQRHFALCKNRKKKFLAWKQWFLRFQSEKVHVSPSFEWQEIIYWGIISFNIRMWIDSYCVLPQIPSKNSSFNQNKIRKAIKFGEFLSLLFILMRQNHVGCSIFQVHISFSSSSSSSSSCFLSFLLLHPHSFYTHRNYCVEIKKIRKKD